MPRNDQMEEESPAERAAAAQAAGGRISSSHLSRSVAMPGNDQMEEESPAERAADAQAAEGRFCNTFVFNFNGQSDTRILEHAGPREHDRDTPRTQLLMPPPTGSTWTWTPTVIGADGADAGPNGILEVVSETVDVYCPVRGHCSVHVN